MTASRFLLTVGLLFAMVLGDSVASADEPNSPTPAIRRATRQSQFTIPFSLDRPSEEIAAVRLFVSTDRGKSWQVASSQAPEAGRFAFRAPGDGVFWFASRTIDQQQRAWPQEPMRAELEVWVDTSQPQLELRPQLEGNRVKVAWSAWDPLLDARTLQLEYYDGRRWQTAELSPQRVGGRLQGVAVTPIVARQFRVAASDHAGNRTILSRQLEAVGAASAAAVAQTPYARKISGPKLPSGIPSDPLQNFRAPATTTPPSASVARLPATTPNTPTTPTNPIADPAAEAAGPVRSTASDWSPRNEPFASAPREPWPQTRQDAARTNAVTASRPSAAHPSATANSAGGGSATTPSPFTSSPPAAVQYSAIAGQVRAPVAARGGRAAVTESAWRRDESVDGLTLPETAKDSATDTSPSALESAPFEATSQLPAGARIQWTNRTRFNIDYQLDSILPEHVGDVELWATADHGKSWAKWGNDPDHVSPVSIKIEEPGVYGFHVVVVSRRGMASVTPKTPADADVWIGVDQTPPDAKLTSAIIASGANAGRLNIQWTADDQQLPEQPIELLYGPSATGPWTTIASSLENSGSYYWQPTPTVPEQIHLKLKATDRAGNVTEHVVPDPIRIESLRPRAMIRTMQPLQGASTVIHADTSATGDREARAAGASRQ